MKKKRLLKRLEIHKVDIVYDNENGIYFSIGNGKIKIYEHSICILGISYWIDLFQDIKMQYLSNLKDELYMDILEDYSFKLGQYRVLNVLFY